jgi:hypothetical protein
METVQVQLIKSLPQQGLKKGDVITVSPPKAYQMQRDGQAIVLNQPSTV